MNSPRPNLAVQVALVLLRGYQLLFSSFMGRSCRFYPTCSSYAAESLRRHGFWRGSGLFIWRLLRCGPWTRGGYDPVPDAITVSDSPSCCAMHHATPEKPDMRAD